MYLGISQKLKRVKFKRRTEKEKTTTAEKFLFIVNGKFERSFPPTQVNKMNVDSAPKNTYTQH
jgi:hypothetical protein